MTSLVKKIEDDSRKGIGIYKYRTDGTLTSGNLDGISYCRICEAVSPSYSAAFHHNTEFRCFRLTDLYSVSCPVCKKRKFTWFRDFSEHIEEHTELFVGITLTNEPEHMRSTDFRYLSKLKSVTMLWIVSLFKKIVEVDGVESEPFLPALTSAKIASRSEILDWEMCPWPMCVQLNGSHYQHKHGYETDEVTGRCRWCNNYHQAIMVHGVENKTCIKQSFRGTIPL